MNATQVADAGRIIAAKLPRLLSPWTPDVRQRCMRDVAAAPSAQVCRTALFPCASNGAQADRLDTFPRASGDGTCTAAAMVNEIARYATLWSG